MILFSELWSHFFIIRYSRVLYLLFSFEQLDKHLPLHLKKKMKQKKNKYATNRIVASWSKDQHPDQVHANWRGIWWIHMPSFQKFFFQKFNIFLSIVWISVQWQATSLKASSDCLWCSSTTKLNHWRKVLSKFFLCSVDEIGIIGENFVGEKWRNFLRLTKFFPDNR